MSMNSDKQRIQSIGNADCPYAHFLPIIEAEKSWGNRLSGDFSYDRQYGEWVAWMAHPLHLEKLREKFEFPDNIKLYAGPARPAERPGDMHYSITDTENMIRLYNTDTHGPSLEPVARFFRNLLGKSAGQGQEHG